MRKSAHSHSKRQAIQSAAIVAAVVAAGILAGGSRGVYAKSGTTWYVNSGPSGNDNNTCLSRKQPCATIPGAMAKASPGDTIAIAKGNYSGGFTIAENLTLKGAKNGLPIISGGSPGITVPSGVTAALSNLQVVGASPGVNNAGTLTLSGNSVIDDGGGVVDSGSLTVSKSSLSNNANNGLTIQGGATAAVSETAIDSNSGTGVSNAGTITVTGGTINSNYGGGAVDNAGTLVLSGTTLNGNSGSCAGGICNEAGASATVVESTISGNTNPNGSAGGVDNSGTVALSDSSVSGNSAGGGSGGGIFNNVNSYLVVTNVTVSGNSTNNYSGTYGGGVYNSGITTLVNSTVSNNLVGGTGCGRNTCYYGGGIFNNGVAGLSNTLLAGNNSDCYGTLSDGNYAHSNNLIGIGDGCGLTNGQNGDQVGSSNSPINPLLGPLASNGGPTQTMALQTGSPAIGTAYAGTCLQKGPGNVNDLDQRGYPRNAKSRGVCDIGAYDTGGNG